METEVERQQKVVPRYPTTAEQQHYAFCVQGIFIVSKTTVFFRTNQLL
jgi:hypothetical protein